MRKQLGRVLRSLEVRSEAAEEELSAALAVDQLELSRLDDIARGSRCAMRLAFDAEGADGSRVGVGGRRWGVESLEAAEERMHAKRGRVDIADQSLRRPPREQESSHRPRSL